MATTLTITVVQQVAGGELIVRSSNSPSFVMDIPAGTQQAKQIGEAVVGLVQNTLTTT